MTELPVLSLMVFLPLVGVLFILMIRGDEARVARNAKLAAVWTSLFTFSLSLYMFFAFDADDPGFQFEQQLTWFPDLGISYHVGVDGISLFFVMLSAFLVPVCILASWDSIKTRVRQYMIVFLLLETFMVGTFTALDALLFYVFYEGSLIPMFLIIGMWGGENRVYSAYKFFLYTLAGSVLMLVGLLALYFMHGTTDIPVLLENPVTADVQKWLWLAFFVSFAIKVPMWPVHTWLPDAHVQAPTAGSVILAGVLLKMGGYGFLRFSLPLFPDASAYFAPLVYGLSIVAFAYASLIAFVQRDMKKLIAYSSVAHMGFVTLGIFTGTMQGIQGGIFQMLSHGLISAALFLCVGVVYDRLHTREMARYGGLVNNMPIYAAVFMILMLGSVGLPGTSGFVGEFLALLGAFHVSATLAFFAAGGIILGAIYMLRLYRKVIFGPLENKDTAAMKDLNRREILIFLPIVGMVLWFGLFPNAILDRTGPAVERLMESYHLALQKPQITALILDSVAPEAGDVSARWMAMPPMPEVISNE
ncbi:MAG: NADH-quinone oxidoreductase subunit M [Alphaproteobacteria bacterium]|nr:NADH-quinone oxidoreductase subunit M [Alphaproteobacteria bacterium]